MARAAPKKKAKSKRPPFRPVRWLLRWAARLCLAVTLFFVAWILLYAVVNPPMTVYMWQERGRLGGIEKTWVDWEEIAPVMGRAAVAAEDANFCLHWGIDITAVRAALDAGGSRGGSTISQKVVKNTFLWHGRTYTRKALEAAITPVMEAVWSKERILEVYLNVAEFDEGVFGVDAAARHYFNTSASELSAVQAARLAAILPAPKARSASNPSSFVQRRAAQIRDGAATIKADGRAACFES